MRFADLLRASVLLCAATASVLALITVLRATALGSEALVYGACAWWLVAVAIGTFLGRRAETSPPIARLLAAARSQLALPDQRPAAVMINRLWPLALFVILAGVLGIFFAQAVAVATGFPIIWALAWRRQEKAVEAIEERDAVRFFVERTSPVRPIKLVRTPGFGGRWTELAGERSHGAER